MSQPRFAPIVAAASALAFACSSGGGAPFSVPAGCQPLLGGGDCFLPYPSDFFRVADASLPSGFRVETVGAARLDGKAGSADVNTLRPIDGFSRIPTLVLTFAVEVADAGFVRLADPPESSLLVASNTVIVDAATGERIPHFVDLDSRATDPKRRAIVLHPLVGLREKARYVVGVHGVKDVRGVPVAAPEGFRRLRDRAAGDAAALAPLRARFDADVFAVLAAAGLARGELQLAWDFTTGTVEHARSDLLRLRELTLAWLAQGPPQVVVTAFEDNPEPDVWRRIHGTITAPLFLTSPTPGSQLARGADGLITQHGTTSFAFVAQVSATLRDQPTPGRALGYGHGYFGSLQELEGGSARNLGQRLSAVLFGAEWWGMHLTDVGVVADGLISHPDRVLAFGDRVHQAMANWMVLTAAIRGPMRSNEYFHRPAGVARTGEPFWAEGAPGYVGISEGAILGGVMAALNPDLTRACLHVGGAGFTHMMMRATPFSAYLGLMKESIPDPLDQQKFIASLQRQFDRFDPATYADLLRGGTLPGAPSERRILMQIGLGDTEVPNLGSYLEARLAGLPLLQPSPVVPFGLTGQAAPVAGSALALFDFGIDTTALYARPEPAAQDTVVHEGLRRRESALSQMDRFFTDGVIVNPCAGPCRPE